MTIASRRDFLKIAPLASLGVALGQAPVRLSKEAWVLQMSPEMRQEIRDEHPLVHGAIEALAETHPPVHEYWRLGDICIQGFPLDRITGKRLEASDARSGLIQVVAMSWKDSEADRTNVKHTHAFLPSRPVHLTGPLSQMREPELLGVLLDTAAAINDLQHPYRWLTTNSNKVYVTLAARLGFCPPNNCSSEVEAVKPYSLFGGDIPFHVTPDRTYQTMARQGKSTLEIMTAFNKAHMQMFPGATADLKQISPLKNQDKIAGYAV